MYPETVNKKTRDILKKLGVTRLLKNFYLAGGTALAIQLGHRQSIDLDFFSKKKFNISNLKKQLTGLGKFKLDIEDKETLSGSLDGVKLSFFYYDYLLLYKLINFNKIKLADERDIAAMKLEAISSRGSKKDFIDLHFLLEKYDLGEIFSFFENKYYQIKYNKLHLLKSLAFFNDADDEPFPVMLKNVSWKKIKEKILNEIKSYN